MVFFYLLKQVGNTDEYNRSHDSEIGDKNVFFTRYVDRWHMKMFLKRKDPEIWKVIIAGYSFPIYHQPISGTSISPTSASGLCPQLSLSHLQGAELQLCGGDYPKIH